MAATALCGGAGKGCIVIDAGGLQYRVQRGGRRQRERRLDRDGGDGGFGRAGRLVAVGFVVAESYRIGIDAGRVVTGIADGGVAGVHAAVDVGKGLAGHRGGGEGHHGGLAHRGGAAAQRCRIGAGHGMALVPLRLRIGTAGLRQHAAVAGDVQGAPVGEDVVELGLGHAGPGAYGADVGMDERAAGGGVEADAADLLLHRDLAQADQRDAGNEPVHGMAEHVLGIIGDAPRAGVQIGVGHR
jgi:hypothetical protein